MLRGPGDRRQKAPSLCFCEEEEVRRGRDLLEVFHPERGGAELQGLLGLLPLSPPPKVGQRLIRGL